MCAKEATRPTPHVLLQAPNRRLKPSQLPRGHASPTAEGALRDLALRSNATRSKTIIHNSTKTNTYALFDEPSITVHNFARTPVPSTTTGARDARWPRPPYTSRRARQQPNHVSPRCKIH